MKEPCGLVCTNVLCAHEFMFFQIHTKKERVAKAKKPERSMLSFSSGKTHTSVRERRLNAACCRSHPAGRTQPKMSANAKVYPSLWHEESLPSKLVKTCCSLSLLLTAVQVFGERRRREYEPGVLNRRTPTKRLTPSGSGPLPY